MKEIEVTIDQDIVNQLEALNYEVQARKSVVAEMLAQNMDIGTSSFEKYQRELVEFTVQYEAAKNELQKQYVDSIDGAERWNLDFNSGILTVTLK